MFYFIYCFILFTLAVYSWGFVDVNSPFRTLPILSRLVYTQRSLSSCIYVGILLALFLCYFWILRQVRIKKMFLRQVIILLAFTVVGLFFSYSAFSNDIFNYIATAKVTYFYHENPYIVMPIEIKNEPMLKFLQASNKTALYGPTWILLTAIPHYLGFGNLFITFFGFKALVLFFYLALTWLIWRFTKNLWTLAFFALNPLVVIDTLVDGHNDVMMMFLALVSFYFLKQKRIGIAVIFLFLSFFVKGASVFLVPVFIYAVWQQLSFSKVNWQRIWFWSALSMYIIFFLSPLREEIYSWYFIWPLTFVALRDFDILTAISLGFTFGLPLRFLPFAYWRNWGGLSPLVKQIVTFIPPSLVAIIYAVRKKF